MNPAGAAFARITTLLENMHAIAVDGRSSSLSKGEGVTLLIILRAGAARLERQIVKASTGLAR